MPRLLAAFRGVCDDTQFVKNFTLIGEWEGEKQKPAVMRVAQKLFQVLWKRVPRREDVLGLLVDVPQQGEAANEKQAGHENGDYEDDGDDDPGQGCFIIDGLLTDRLTPWTSFISISKKHLNLNAVSCPWLKIFEDLQVILSSN